MQLPELQRQLVSSINSDSDTDQDSELSALLSDNTHFRNSERLNVYRNNYFGGLHACLQSIYPVIERILGEDYFKTLSHSYIRQFPSQDNNLNNYGAFLPEYLTSLLTSRKELAEFPYLADLAQLESSLHRLYYSANPASFDFHALSIIEESQQSSIIFHISPCLAWMSTPFPVREIYLSHQNGHPPNEIRGLSEVEYLIIQRIDFVNHILSVDENVYRLLEDIHQSLNLQVLCKRHADINELLSYCLQNHFIDSFGQKQGSDPSFR